MAEEVQPLGGIIQDRQVGFGAGIQDGERYADGIAAIAYGFGYKAHDIRLEFENYSGKAGDHAWLVARLI